MPKVTLSFPFELKIAEAANKTAAQFIDDYDASRENRFILILNDESDEIELFQSDNAEAFFTKADELEEKDCSFLSFDHFDKYGYAYLKWNGIRRQSMEKLFGCPFEEKDFIHMRTKEMGQFRESGSVMLG